MGVDADGVAEATAVKNAVKVTAADPAAGSRDAVLRRTSMTSREDAAVAGPRFDTLCVSPVAPCNDGSPLIPAIVQSTTFCRSGLGSTAEHRYSRESNPTVAALEIALGRLEQALPALCFATGLAAETTLLLAATRSGDHVICSRAVYGGTHRLLRAVFAAFGVEASFVDTTDAHAVEVAWRPSTRLVFVETPANPTLVLSDIAAIAEVTRQRGALLCVDNTFLTPILQQPLELGADVSVYSTTKFVEGHSAALGGALVVRDPSLRERLFFLRKCSGAIQSPLNAWLTLQGLKTLPLRIERQSRNAAVVAGWLARVPAVRWVSHPSLENTEQRELASRQHAGLHGAVVSFELEGGAESARRLLEEVRLCRLAEHVGSVETLLTHPASMTHGSVPAEERAQIGINEGLLRLSVGLEDPRDVIADLDRSIGKARCGAAVEQEVA